MVGSRNKRFARYGLFALSLLSITCLSLARGFWDAASNVPLGDYINGELSAEKRLLAHLMRSYLMVGRVGRPVRNISSPVVVTFGLGLIHMDLDEKDKVLTMSMWTKYQWLDEYLSWDPAENEGVEIIRLESDAIWIPDIALYNTADVATPMRDALVEVRHNGTVTWYPHGIYRSMCKIDVSNFPFDEQNCTMAFGSWTYTSAEVDIRLADDNRLGFDLSTFRSDHQESTRWEILRNQANRRLLPSPDEEPNFTVLIYEIQFKRKTMFSTYILTLPCVFLASLTLVVFWLPPERPDRTALGMSTFASFMVLLLILVEAAPPTANSVPTLGVYYCFNMVIIVLAIILSSLVVNIARGSYDRKTRAAAWMRILFLRCIGRLMRLQAVLNLDSVLEPRQFRQPRKCRDCTDCLPLVQSSGGDLTTNHAEQNNSLDKAASQSDGLDHVIKSPAMTAKVYSDFTLTILRQMQLDVNEMRSVTRNMCELLYARENRELDEQAVEVEWQTIALVLDRLFFLLYVTLIVLSLIFFFPQPM